jgi:hypothetical protein
VTEFYGIQTGTIPGFAEAGGMHAQDSLAFEVCVRHVASVIEDQRRKEGHADPRDDRAPDIQLWSAVLAHQATRRMP